MRLFLSCAYGHFLRQWIVQSWDYTKITFLILANCEDDDNANNFCHNDGDENDENSSKIRHKQLNSLTTYDNDATGKFSTHLCAVGSYALFFYKQNAAQAIRVPLHGIYTAVFINLLKLIISF